MSNQHPIADIEDLRQAVRQMDALSQGAFTEISSVARLALAWMEVPGGPLHMDVIADALGVIWGKADEFSNFINTEAEQVGCNYVDEAQQRRWDAESGRRAADRACNERARS